MVEKVVPSTLLVSYKGKGYSVPPNYINKRVKIYQIDNELYIYCNNDLIATHEISNKSFNYKEEHYIQGLSSTIRKNLFRSYLVEEYANQINTNNLEIKLKVSVYHFMGIGIIFYGTGYDYYELADHCNIINPLYILFREEFEDFHYPLMEARLTIANMFVNYLIN